MAIKANASAQGSDFKRFVGVGSFRVLGVNPTKAELEKFYGREIQNEPEYLKKMVDTQDNNKPYEQLRLSFMIQADDPMTIADITPRDKEAIKTNASLESPYKTMITFFIDSRYRWNSDKTKVQVIDKYGRTAWVTVEQCKNHQIPVYSNGPAKIDAGYRPLYRGEEELTQFVDNYLNITPIETKNKNTGEWITNPHPEDCEGWLEHIKEYFTGNIKEIKEYCTYMPDNRLKLLTGIRTDDQGNQYGTVYTRMTLRNGAKNYTRFKDSIEGQGSYLSDVVFTNNPDGTIENIAEFSENVKETNFNSVSQDTQDPFAAASALPEDDPNDLPFGEPEDKDPFSDLA